MNRSAKDGTWSSPHYGDEGAWVPLRRTKVCAGDTVGKSVSDSGRPGIVRRQGMAGIVRHSQTKGRATGNAKPSLKPANGRCGYKAQAKFRPMRCQESDRGEVLSNGIRTKGSGSPPLSGDAGWIQKTNRRGKAPYCVAASGDEGLVSR